MSNKFVVAYDDSAPSRRAIDFAIERAKLSGAELVLAHVLEWSPYSFLTPTEIEERHSRREKELERAEKAIVAPILEQLASSGVTVTSEIRFGQVSETLINIARSHGASQIIIGRTGHTSMASRLFGSVAGTLAQASPVPCTIVP